LISLILPIAFPSFEVLGFLLIEPCYPIPSEPSVAAFPFLIQAFSANSHLFVFLLIISAASVYLSIIL